MYETIKPWLFKLDPEMAHELVHAGLQIAQSLPYGTTLLSSKFSFPSSKFLQKIWELDFSNPIGLAAGFDKNAKVVDGMAALGFGFLELGSVTNRPCSGNDRPRLFRLPEDQALINRLGLNNTGPYRFLENLASAKSLLPKLISISKTNDPSLNGEQAIEDMMACYRIVGPAARVIVFNLSCPNTKDGKTFEDEKALTNLLTAIVNIRKSESFTHPFLVKFSCDVDLEKLKEFLDISLAHGTGGFVLSNTSNSREGLFSSKEEIDRIGRGGLSGKPIFRKSLERVSTAFKHINGRVPIIGLGGVDSGESALEMIKSGASLVELYTGLVYKGPALIRNILIEIDKELSKSNLVSISSIIGSSC